MIDFFSPAFVFSLLRLAVVMMVFLLPGFGVATWLMRHQNLSGPACWALGFAMSFALFALLGWPFLWFHCAFSEFLRLLYPIWVVYSAAGLVAYLLSHRHRSSAPVQGAFPEENPLSPADLHRPKAHVYGPLTHRPGVLLPVYLLAVIAILYLFQISSLRPILLALAPLMLLGFYALSRRLPGEWRSAAAYNERDQRPSPRLWRSVAIGAVALQVLAIAIGDRPDWDDCYYLAAVLDYQHAAALNSEEPTHREGLPVPTQHRTLCWQLWSAVVCELTGLSPASLLHTLMPMVLLLLAYGAYVGLLQELLPRYYVPLGVLGLSAVHLWGISSHASVANFLLPRLWQGKAVLLHLAVTSPPE